MNLILFDNVIKDPDTYVEDILNGGFEDIYTGFHTFKGIQPRGDDEFSEYLKNIFPDYVPVWNFVRMSPLGQEEPTYIHTDEMMGDITVILYLNKKKPNDDGTTIYDDEGKPSLRVFSKYNRMIAFDSTEKHSRTILENFGHGDKSRLIQVVFLKCSLIS